MSLASVAVGFLDSNDLLDMVACKVDGNVFVVLDVCSGDPRLRYSTLSSGLRSCSGIGLG
jgi:hypothetical protein